jgi:RNA polymerase sigma-70 factor (ECF subfamily)
MAHWARPETIAAAQSGDENARASLVTAIWPGCFRLAASVVGDAVLAQDVAQEACAIVHGRIRSLRDVGAFDAWVYRIVMHEAARVRRRNPPSYELPDRPTTPDDGTAAIDVWRALAGLPADQRDVVVLFYFDDLSTEEIAKILRVAHVTVRTRLLRARERLRGILDNYRPEPAPQWEANHRAL